MDNTGLNYLQDFGFLEQFLNVTNH